jgi:hypothetical protein
LLLLLGRSSLTHDRAHHRWARSFSGITGYYELVPAPTNFFDVARTVSPGTETNTDLYMATAGYFDTMGFRESPVVTQRSGHSLATSNKASKSR